MLDAGGYCCSSGLLDDCGVCDGDGSSCALHVIVTSQVYSPSLATAGLMPKPKDSLHTVRYMSLSELDALPACQKNIVTKKYHPCALFACQKRIDTNQVYFLLATNTACPLQIVPCMLMSSFLCASFYADCCSRVAAGYLWMQRVPLLHLAAFTSLCFHSSPLLPALGYTFFLQNAHHVFCELCPTCHRQ